MTADERPPARRRAPRAAGGRRGRSVGRGGRGIRLVGRGGAAAGGGSDGSPTLMAPPTPGSPGSPSCTPSTSPADAALTVSLAGTVFALPTDEARGRVALFLVLTMAPFVLLAPLIGPLLDRFRHGRRWALGTTLATRAFLAWVLATAVVDDSAVALPRRAGLPGRQPLVRRGARRGRAAAAAPRHQPGHRQLPPHDRRADRDGDRRRARRRALADRPGLVAAAGVRRLRRGHRARHPAAGPGRLHGRRARPRRHAAPARGRCRCRRPAAGPGGCAPCRPRCATCCG